MIWLTIVFAVLRSEIRDGTFENYLNLCQLCLNLRRIGLCSGVGTSFLELSMSY